MHSSLVGMIAAGALFSVWPLVMAKSGLGGMASTAAFIALSAMVIFPAAALSGVTLQSVTSAKWQYALGAAVLASAGLVLMNRSLGAADPKQIGSLLLIMILAQVAGPAIYQVLVGAMTMKLVGGILAAVVAIFLLV